MNKLTLAAQTIKDNVSALDVGHAIGLEIRHGRCRCPIHGGRDFNCVLYAGNRGWFCHVCHAGGDVLSFIQQYYNMSFKDAVRWFNGTFNLGMNIDSPVNPEAEKRASDALEKRRQEREFLEWKERMRFDLALTADEIVRKLEEERDAKRPRRYSEEWDPDFCSAVITLPEARRFADDCMMECIEKKGEKQ